MPAFRSISVAALAFAVAFISFAVAPRAASAAARPLTCASERGPLRLCGAMTDNYKDCYGAVDGKRDLRTWLQFRLVRARRATWRIGPVAQTQFAASYTLEKTGGSRAMPARATLSIAGVPAGTAFHELRNGPPAWHFGPFVQLQSDTVLDHQRVAVRLVLRGPTGRRIATTVVSYVRDRALHNAPATSIEANGPGGRWYVGGRRTPTDVEAGSGATCEHPAG